MIKQHINRRFYIFLLLSFISCIKANAQDTTVSFRKNEIGLMSNGLSSNINYGGHIGLGLLYQRWATPNRAFRSGLSSNVFYNSHTTTNYSRFNSTGLVTEELRRRDRFHGFVWSTIPA